MLRSVILLLVTICSVALAQDGAPGEAATAPQPPAQASPRLRSCNEIMEQQIACRQFRSPFPKLESKSFNGKTLDEIQKANPGLSAYSERLSITQMANCIDSGPWTADQIHKYHDHCVVESENRKMRRMNRSHHLKEKNSEVDGAVQ